MSKLHRYYIDDNNERHPCVKDEEWHEFVTESCDLLGKQLFSNSSKQLWPAIGIDALKKELFEVCIVSIVYAFSSIFPVLKYRSSSWGDESRYNCLLLNRFTILLSALIQNYLNIEGASLDTLKDKLNEIYEHFPCEWSHIKKSLVEVSDLVKDFSMHDFRKPKSWELER